MTNNINLVELVNQALGFVKTKEYDEAMAIYKSILEKDIIC